MQALVWNGHLEWLTDLETCHISLEQSLSLVEYRILLEKFSRLNLFRAAETGGVSSPSEGERNGGSVL